MSYRVLVVDDDRSMVRTLSDVLRLNGWEVGGAYSGTEAVEAVQASPTPFDVVLMDVRMPGMDGVDALKIIKERQPKTCVLLMTAYATRDRVAEAERAGALRVLSKPVDISALLELLSVTRSSLRPVLIVDDDHAFLQTLCDALTLNAFETARADSIAEAMRIVRDRRPVAVLLHTHVGASSVSDVVGAMHAVGPTTALILYSGRPFALDEVNRSVPGDWVRAYLQKPFAIDEVVGVLNAVRKLG